MAQEYKQGEAFEEKKYDNEDLEEYDQEVIVNDTDLRIKVTECSDRKENIMECIGYLKCEFIYDTPNQYRKVLAGTATVFYVGSKGETFAVTCAHNVRTVIWHCQNCDQYMDDHEKEKHNECDINYLNEKIIKATKITFTKRCIVKKKEIKIDRKTKEIIEYGDTERIYGCDVDNMFINDIMYSLYPTASGGYDLCVIKFIEKTNNYKNLVKNIRIGNGKETTSEIGHFNIWGFPGDKINKLGGQNGLYGMKSHKNGKYSFPIHKKSKKIYFKQNSVDAYSGQSGSSIWVKHKEKYLRGWAEWDIVTICGVHSGGNSKRKHNIGILFDDSSIKQINNFINNKEDIDKFDITNIGKYHTLNGNVITCNNDYGYSSSLLSNTVFNGNHNWQFKIKSKQCDWISLGIWKTKSGNPPINDSFCDNNNGYGYQIGFGRDHDSNKYGIECKENDIISMFLDMNRYELSFAINGNDYGILTAIEKTKYKAAVYISNKNASLEFLSYMFY